MNQRCMRCDAQPKLGPTSRDAGATGARSVILRQEAFLAVLQVGKK